jgi:Fur family ferric uptake transcriptional regulator
MGQRELNILREHLSVRGLRNSERREFILESFLHAGGHHDVEKLHARIRKERPEIGIATVYRAMKLFCEAGICGELRLDDGRVRYEPLRSENHHDHLVCTRCGKVVEVSSNELEKLQERIAEKQGFLLTGHRLNLFGLCPSCRNKKAK